MKQCLIEGCYKQAVTKYCKKHDHDMRRYNEPRPYRQRKICSMEGCEEWSVANSLCSSHYYRKRKYGSPLGEYMKKEKKICIVEDCNEEVVAKERCACHYGQYLYYRRRQNLVLCQEEGCKQVAYGSLTICYHHAREKKVIELINKKVEFSSLATHYSRS